MKENKTEYLVGNENVSCDVFEPYAEIIIDFLGELSSKLLKYMNFSDVVSLGYYCRKANIKKLKEQYEDGKVRLGRGSIFHITPSNVPINFAFSYVFGLLSGCSNIVRVPSKPYEQTKIVCDEINELFKNEKYSTIARSTAFITYPIDDEITTEFSKKAACRIIWGGDNTVNNVKGLTSSPRCVDIAFSDRYSFMVVDAEKVVASSQKELIALAKNFYNDTFFIDQNACSSPHLIVWLGEDIANAKELFWNAVKTESAKYALEPIKVVDKYTMLLSSILDCEEIAKATKHDNLIYRMQLKLLPNNMESLRGKFGLFYEYDCGNLNEISNFVSEKCQTVTYYGDVKDCLLRVLLDNKLHGIDRIVPVGQAMSIGVIWDGYDIIKTLSRIISIN